MKRLLLIVLSLIIIFVFSCKELGITWPEDSQTNNGEDSGDQTGDQSEEDQNVAAPVITPLGGDVKAMTQISMSTTTTGAIIYYTTDGETPTTVSEIYSSDAKPRLYEDTVFKAIAVKSGVVSPVTTVQMTMTPLYDEFQFDLSSGTKWSYTYTRNHNVSYSWSGDTSFTSSYDFDIIVGEAVQIGDLTAYDLIVLGSYNLEWNYIAQDGYRILVSEDGINFSVVFDSMYGFWVGKGFFADFGSDDSLISAVAHSDGTYEMGTGWSYSDNDSAYYPGIGTIYDPDYLYLNSSLEEEFKTGIGPFYYRKYSSQVDSYEAKSDTYTIVFNTMETGVDYSLFSTDATISDNEKTAVNFTDGTCRVEVEVSNNYANYVCYVEGFIFSDPVFTVYSKNEGYAPIVVDVDDRNDAYEAAFLGVAGGDCIVEISGLGTFGDTVDIWFIESSYPDTTGQFFSYLSETRVVNLSSGSSIVSSLDGSTYAARMFKPTSSLGGNVYFYAIPLSSNIDLRLAVMDDVSQIEGGYSFTGDNFIRYMNDNGVGEPEVFTYSDWNFYVQVWEDADNDNSSEESGNFLFGWGTY